ncbi:hypothetical protein JCM5353_008294, partial [Sporobolomyces roseus]
ILPFFFEFPSTSKAAVRRRFAAVCARKASIGLRFRFLASVAGRSEVGAATSGRFFSHRVTNGEARREGGMRWHFGNSDDPRCVHDFSSPSLPPSLNSLQSTMLTKSPSGLDQLRSIQSQVNKLIDDFESSGSALPSLDEPGLPGRDLPDQNPTLEQISILARQLQAVCDGPRYTLTKAIEFHVSSCLRLAVAAHVEEILREAGQPLSANEIAKFSSLNPDKLAQCLRLLASNHIFVEVEKGVFARNRLSAILDTGKSLDFIKAYVF